MGQKKRTEGLPGYDTPRLVIIAQMLRSYHVRCSSASGNKLTKCMPKQHTAAHAHLYAAVSASLLRSHSIRQRSHDVGVIELDGHGRFLHLIGLGICPMLACAGPLQHLASTLVSHPDLLQMMLTLIG